jgi:SSS family transporter
MRDDSSQFRKVRSRAFIRAGNQLAHIFQSPELLNLAQQACAHVAIMRAQPSANRLQPNPAPRPLIADHRPPSARGHHRAIRATPRHVRSRPRNHQHTRPTLERRIQRNLLIAAHDHLTADQLAQRRFRPHLHAFARSPRQPHASPHHILQRNAGRTSRLAHHYTQPFGGGIRAHCHDLHRRPNGPPQHPRLVRNPALRLGPTRIHRHKNCHHAPRFPQPAPQPRAKPVIITCINTTAPTRLHPFDLALVAVYLIGITLFGLSFRKRNRGGPAKTSLKSYFLADNTIPWWAIALSIVSAETSTLTIISIPGVAFAGDFGFLQVVLGYMLGRIVVAALFLPRYFAGEMLTAYQLIDRRFGPTLHKVTAGLFLLTRAAAEGVRVFAVSIVVGLAIGTRDILSIAIISALTLLYTFEGGMAAVVWTDVVQMAIYIAGTFVALWSLGHHVPGGWPTIHAVAGAAGKFHMLNFALNLTTTYTFWAGVLGGTFLTMASHGTDQLMVQRLLAARNLRESRLALLSSGAVIFLQFTLFLLIGAGLYVFYGAGHSILHPLTSIPSLSPDRIFPTFIVRELPLGIAGLLVAAILAAAMSNLSAALNSLSSTTVVDFYMRLRPQADTRERNLISKSSTVLWALVLFAIAVYSVHAGGKGHVVEIGLSIASVAYGCLLGVFLLGTLTKFATETGATIGMICGFLLNIALWQFPGKVLLSGWLYTPAADQSWAHPPAIISIPKVAWTWYVLIGALVTFAIGALASLIFRRQSRRTLIQATTTAAILALTFSGLSFRSEAQESASSAAAQTPGAPFIALSHRAMNGEAQKPEEQATTRYPEASASGLIAAKEEKGLQPPGYALPTPTPDFSQVTQLITDAIAAHKLPGAVVLIGHDNRIVFEQAYGDRKLANEPGPDGQPSPAEPMTLDTIFDMASLTKCLATATAVMQLYDAGKLQSFDDPVEKYLPAFNETHDPTRSRVTVRMLLTHFSGEAPDVPLKEPWGLATPDRAEGFHLALTTPLKATPGAHFEYSDINFILLGMIVEKLSGETEDVYTEKNIFKPLGMAHTRYLPFAKACGEREIRGAAIVLPIPLAIPNDGKPHGVAGSCNQNQWHAYEWISNTAPTTHDNEGNATTNPHFDMLTRGTVHDPTTRRMGGVAGHAGVFSTAHDVSLFAQALLDKLNHNTGPFPVKQSTLRLMTEPEQPGHTPQQIPAANAAEAASIRAGDKPAAPLLAPHYPAIKGQDLRGFGWDIDTAFSKPRGRIFPIGTFGHTGFTGTSLWMDPASNTYVILLANAIHPRGNIPISALRGEVATAAAAALHVDIVNELRAGYKKWLDTDASGFLQPGQHGVINTDGSETFYPDTLTGIDVLESTNFTALTTLAKSHHNHLNLAILTNQSGLDSHHHRTIDILNALTTYNVQLTTLFSPEHGLFAAQDTTHLNAETDPATHLHVTSLYGAHDADRRPSHDQLKDLDCVIIDLQDAGVHFWTYESVLGYFLEASSTERLTYHHALDIVVLDRPNPLGGLAVQGPTVDPAHTSYVAYMPLPVRHGLTYAELAQYIVATRHLATHLTVVPMQNWQRGMFWSATGLPWTNPSPNLRSPEAALLYPALGLIETTSVSVGRGTAHPFSFFGATWLNAPQVAATLTARSIPGVAFTAATEPIAEDANHYPFQGQTIPAVRVTLTDPTLADTPELGIEILSALNKLYPTELHLVRAMTILANQSTLDALTRNEDPRTIATTWQPALTQFKAATAPYLLYK